jgi:hypothetical protein
MLRIRFREYFFHLFFREKNYSDQNFNLGNQQTRIFENFCFEIERIIRLFGNSQFFRWRSGKF